MGKRLSKKQEGFVKDYLETGNATQSALNNYDTTDENVAAGIGWENLRKPQIIAKLQNASEGALSTIVALSQGAENENVRLSASKDILDRTGFNPQKDQGNTTNNIIMPVLVKFIEKDDKGTSNDSNTDRV